MNKKNSFMKNLKKIRKMKGLSQQDLAIKCGLTSRIISYYENESINPPLDKIEIIAKTLGVTVSDLLDEKLSTKKIEAEDIDPRILKKINKIKSLPNREQNKIWDYMNTIIKNYEHEEKEKVLMDTK